jgi:hypothetical protein
MFWGAEVLDMVAAAGSIESRWKGGRAASCCLAAPFRAVPPLPT